jgi:hypothetical protein
LRYPALISLLTFIIRLSVKEINFSTNEELHAEYERIINENWLNKDNEKNRIFKDNDVRMLSVILPVLDTVIARHASVFTEELSPLYTDSSVSNNVFHNNNGILSLARFLTTDTDLNMRLKKLMEKK